MSLSGVQEMYFLLQMSVNSEDNDNVIEVHIEIKSNWGHPMRLGLTEIQLYDGNHSLLQVAPSDVTVFGAEECKGTIDVLFNGKFKVTFRNLAHHNKFEPRHEISNNVVCSISEASDQPAHRRSLIRAFASSLNIL